jgi:hypothetical protein
MFAPADTPMKLNMIGPGKRDALFIIVHDSSKPTTTFLDWKPKGLCQKLGQSEVKLRCRRYDRRRV